MIYSYVVDYRGVNCYQDIYKKLILPDSETHVNKDGGGRGIRTPGTVTSTTVFETVPFDRSGSPPYY